MALTRRQAPQLVAWLVASQPAVRLPVVVSPQEASRIDRPPIAGPVVEVALPEGECLEVVPQQAGCPAPEGSLLAQGLGAACHPRPAAEYQFSAT